jgi:hypothetical protein
MRLSRLEQETIINFNQAEDTAYIYTCSKAWINHFEKVLKLKPTIVHEHHAREYECPKAWIRKPLKPRKLSDGQKVKLKQRLQPHFNEVTPYAVGVSDNKHSR